MLLQPPLRPYRRRRMKAASDTFLKGFCYVCMVAAALAGASEAQGQEESATKLTEGFGRRILAGNSPIVATNGDDLLRKVADALRNNSGQLDIYLAGSSFNLTATLNLPVSTSIYLSGNTKQAVIRCVKSAEDSMSSLIDFSGSALLLQSVILEGCSCPGLRVSNGSANVNIKNSTFRYFTRTLVGRYFSNSTEVSPLGPDSTSLAIYATDFKGSLSISHSYFSFNSFLGAPDTRRSLRAEEASRGAGVRADRLGEVLSARPRQAFDFGPDDEVLMRADATLQRFTSAEFSRKYRRLHGMTSVASRPGPLILDEQYPLGSSWQMAAARRTQSSRRRQLQDALSTGYSMRLLQNAKLLHPDLQTGPWADDVETVVAVMCRGEATDVCNVQLDTVTFNDNTGVATGALYVLCDGMQRCNVEMKSCDVRNNKLLWQDATYLQPEYRLFPQPPDSSEPDYDNTAPPYGLDMITAMVPWLTYTYPLLEAPDPLLEDSDNSVLDYYPNIAGRTLGAVVFHQKSSPWPGVPDAMMSVAITGGNYTGNDGSAIMSTATDFMEMAGGNGSWPNAPPRHSADFNLSSVSVKDQGSGWPAIWLRWAKSVGVSSCTVGNSTGAIWLDEVRDSAVIEQTGFYGNKLNHLWLDIAAYSGRLKFFDPEIDGAALIGVGASHVVKIQMTALGGVENTATVRNCRFKGNPSFVTGVLYVTASDEISVDKDNLPGETVVTVTNTTFNSSSCLCLSSDPSATQFCRDQEAASGNSANACHSGERALLISKALQVNVQGCRFTNNSNGGLYLSTVNSATIGPSDVNSMMFDGNSLTADMTDGTGGSSYGGAGLYAIDIGTGGLSVVGATFTKNAALRGGGAVYIKGIEYAEFNYTRFDSNTAQTYDGGAVWMETAGSSGLDNFAVLFNGCTFTNNSAGRNGGAISGRNIDLAGKGWMVQNCTLVNNVALINPNPLQFGPGVQDQAGGGAVFTSGSTLTLADSNFTGNKVRAHAGGAVRIVDSRVFTATNVWFIGNMAIMGGAVAISRVSANQNQMMNCTFLDNTVLNPWTWPDTTPVQPSPGAQIPLVALIDPGYGGAVYSVSAATYLGPPLIFRNNSAKFGGAVAVVSSTQLVIPGFSGRRGADLRIDVPVPAAVAQNAGVNGSSLPCQVLFAENTAQIGGALYLYDTDSFSSVGAAFGQAELVGQPAVLFLGNKANGGGGAYFEGNGQVNLASTRFVMNQASPLPLAGLFGRELDNATAKARPCFGGGGGGVCVVGQAAKEVMISSCGFFNNAAKDGGGLYLAEGLDCISQTGCYQVVLQSVDMKGNQAANRGGGIFWMHEGVLAVAGCPADRQQNFITDGRNVQLPSGSGGSIPPTSSTFTIPMKITNRKPPAAWYGHLRADSQRSLLDTVGGPVNASRNPLRAVNGVLAATSQAVFANSIDPGTTVVDQNQLVAVKGAFLTPVNNGTLRFHNGSLSDLPLSYQAVDALPVVLSGSVINDTAWQGVPYTNLPCAEWLNSADTGDDIASTPYFLLDPPPLDFYTSNSDIQFNVTVHDWLGNQCTGDNQTQPLVIVQADSPEVSGAVAVRVANGSATFTSLRLRAREGLHSVALTGQLYAPVRVLEQAQVQIYVRPCAINEFLSPKNLDECIPCDTGNFNLNVSATSCQPCPDNADCAYPDPSVCKTGDCKPVGFMVPQDGYWHASFFSEQVLECPNSDSCTYPNRSDLLSSIQFRVWQAARQIQLNTSNAVAFNATAAGLRELLRNQPALRRLLQQKAINDTEDTAQVLLVSEPMAGSYEQSLCAVGYMGTLCGQCAPGYGWRRIATCNKCPPRALNNLYYALVTLLTLSMLAFTIYSSLKEQARPGLLVGGTTGKGGKPAKITPAGGAGRGSSMSPLGPGRPEAVGLILDPIDGHIRENPGYDPTADYTDPALAAAMGHYGSAPGTPGTPKSKFPPGAAMPFPAYNPAIRSHSVVGVPMRRGSVQWSSPQDRRRPPPPPWSRVEYASGSYTAGSGRSPLGMGGSYTAGAPRSHPQPYPYAHPYAPRFANMAAGPVAEATSFTAGQPGLPHPVVVQHPPAVEAEAAEVPTGYDNVLYEERAGGAPPVQVYPDCFTAGKDEEEEEEEQEARERHEEDDEGQEEEEGELEELEEHHEEDAEMEQEEEGLEEQEVDEAQRMYDGDHGMPMQTGPSVSHPAFPPGLMLQSVPVMPGSPPLSPRMAPMSNQAVSSPKAGGGLPPTPTDRAASREARKRANEARERAHQSTVVKIFVSYVQVLALLQNIPLDIPGVVDVYYRINNQAISYPGILVSLDCSLPNSGISKAVVRVTLTVLAPLYIFAGAVIFFIIFNILDYYFITPYYEKKERKKRRKRHRQLPSFRMHMECYLGRHLIVTFITIFFFFYPSVVQSLMTIFNCQDVNSPSPSNPLADGMGLQTDRVWSQDFGMECYKGVHMALAMGLGVPGVLLIALGWPILSALFMTGKLPCINNIRFTEDMVNFFLADFKRKYAWWESVIMLRKLFIAIIVTLVDGPTSAGVQLLLVVCVLVLAMGVHIMFMPYRHLYTNNLELLSLGTLLVTLYLSLYSSFSSSISAGGRITISVLILVINIAMIITFVYYIIQAYYYSALCSTGLSSLDRETRRKLTPAELQRRILENLTQPSTTSGNNESGHGPDLQERASYQHVASIYAAAVWASMRVGSTTNKMLTRVRTLLPQHGLEGPPSRPPSREGSIAGSDPLGLGADGQKEGRAGSLKKTGTATREAATVGAAAAADDPESGLGSGGSSRRSSHTGAQPAADKSGDRTSKPVVGERTSKPVVGDRTSKPTSKAAAGDHTPKSAAGTPTGASHGNGSAIKPSASRGRSTSASGQPPVSNLPASPSGRQSTGGQQSPTEEVAAAASSPYGSSASQQELPRASSLGAARQPCDSNPRPPPYATALEVPSPTGAGPQGSPTSLSPLGVAHAPGIAAHRQNGVRSMSRLAVASNQATRSGELLPPPPSFAVLNRPQAGGSGNTNTPATSP